MISDSECSREHFVFSFVYGFVSSEISHSKFFDLPDKLSRYFDF